MGNSAKRRGSLTTGATVISLACVTLRQAQCESETEHVNNKDLLDPFVYEATHTGGFFVDYQEDQIKVVPRV